MKQEKEIIGFVKKFSYLWSDYITTHLMQKNSIQLIEKIVESTNKSVSESVLILLAVIRFLLNDRNALIKIEEKDNFNNFIKEKENEIIEIACQKNVQANLPERAFPVLEILGKVINEREFSVIELGASYGLIGHCLLNYKKLLNNKDRYFVSGQQFPEKSASIKNYCGIEIDPPELNWLLACIPSIEEEIHIENFISDIDIKNSHKVVKASALGFSKIKEVQDILHNNSNVIILTSFMLYQFDTQNRNKLIKEINDVIKNENFHWVNQTVNICHHSQDNEYYIELDGKKIIELFNDRCFKWEWL